LGAILKLCKAFLVTRGISSYLPTYSLSLLKALLFFSI
jgi:hypothetical protein